MTEDFESLFTKINMQLAELKAQAEAQAERFADMDRRLSVLDEQLRRVSILENNKINS